MIIAVLDDGVNSVVYPYIGQLVYDVEVDELLQVIPRNAKNVQQSISHGTVCAAIIKKYANKAQIASVKVLDPATCTGGANQVVRALEWCDEQNINFLHMSIGSTQLSDYPKLRDIIMKLLKKGCIIVAAMSNQKLFSAPSDIAGVIRVKADTKLIDQEIYAGSGTYRDGDFHAASMHTLLDTLHYSECISGENSYAAPVISALIHNVLLENPLWTVNQIKKYLYRSVAPNDLGVTYPLFVGLFPDFYHSSIWIGASQKTALNGVKDKEAILKMGEAELSAKEYLVLLSDVLLNEDLCHEWLIRNKEFLKGILFAGSAPLWLKKFCCKIGCFFWDESEYWSRMTKTFTTKENCSIPIIYIYGSLETTIKITKIFSSCLFGQEYPNIIISDSPLAYCEEMLWIPSVSALTDELLSCLNYFNISAAMICSDSYYPNREEWVDLKIAILDRPVEQCNGKTEISSFSTEDQLFKTCYHIIDYLKGTV